MKPPVLITVHYFTPGEDRPTCAGCAPTSETSAIVQPVPAVCRILGCAFELPLCTDCALNTIKSLAARFAMFDRRASRDLLDFFAAGPAKRPRVRRKASAASTRKRPPKVIDLLGPPAPDPPEDRGLRVIDAILDAFTAPGHGSPRSR